MHYLSVTKILAWLVNLGFAFVVISDAPNHKQLQDFTQCYTNMKKSLQNDENKPTIPMSSLVPPTSDAYGRYIPRHTSPTSQLPRVPEGTESPPTIERVSKLASLDDILARHRLCYRGRSLKTSPSDWAKELDKCSRVFEAQETSRVDGISDCQFYAKEFQNCVDINVISSMRHCSVDDVKIVHFLENVLNKMLKCICNSAPKNVENEDSIYPIIILFVGFVLLSCLVVWGLLCGH